VIHISPMSLRSRLKILESLPNSNSIQDSGFSIQDSGFAVTTSISFRWADTFRTTAGLKKMTLNPEC
jgi:hypothetical protein